MVSLNNLGFIDGSTCLNAKYRSQAEQCLVLVMVLHVDF